MSERSISFRLNGVDRTIATEPRTLLCDVLRHDLGCTGVHVGCEQGACGACTVIWNGRAVRSCLALAPQADGAVIETIESIAPSGELHPVQAALHEHHGLQCGFCTPGMVLSLVAALRSGTAVTVAKEDVLNGHLCRCTGYVNIRDAIDAAWAALDGDA